MSPTQKSFFAILLILAFLGFSTMIMTNPLKVLLMFLIPAILLFIIKKYALDPVKKRYAPRRTFTKKIERSRRRSTTLNRPHSFRVIEGNKNKKV